MSDFYQKHKKGIWLGITTSAAIGIGITLYLVCQSKPDLDIALPKLKKPNLEKLEIENVVPVTLNTVTTPVLESFNPSLSAQRIGQAFGQTAKEINLLLQSKGFLTGKPGKWELTEKGRRFGKEIFKDNGYGGYAARSWNFLLWDERIIDGLKLVDYECA